MLPLVSLLAATALLAAATLTASGCRRERIVETPIVVWRPVNSWSGHASLQTESFPGQSGAFRLEWESRPDGQTPPARLRVTLHSAISGRPLAVVVDHEGAGHDTNFVTDDPRTFFLVIESEATQWSVKIEEGISAMKREVQKD